MTTAIKTSTRKAWAGAIAQPAKEFPLTPLPVLSGKIPEGLRGSLYRNGPARLERGNTRVGHWFDGDGAILCVNFTSEGATAVYRYVQTDGYLKESAANKFLFPNYGMTVPGGFWNNWFKPVKNAANTSVLALSDRVLSLWEGGQPHALDLKTLATWGTEDLSNLKNSDPFSAHPKIDPETGEIYNFGVSPGLNATLNLYRCNPTGKVLKKGTVKLDGLPLIHDFVMAGDYLIFFVPPVRINLLPAAIGLSSFSDSMQWKPELGTQILVIDRHTLTLVSKNIVDPWYQWHFANGYVELDNSVIVELVRFPDFQTNQNLKEVATGEIKTPAKGTLWKICLNPKTGEIIEQGKLFDRGCEFPIVPQQQVGKPWRYTHLAVHRDGADSDREIFGAIARFDRQTGSLAIADLGENRYPSEPIYVPDPNNLELGWLLTVVYDGNTNTSEVRIYRCDRLEDEPVCRLELPSVIPHSFHGIWKDHVNC
ncbi:MAG: carotenoid oxygenase family protein [Xenococcaceae cyanobacterium]